MREYTFQGVSSKQETVKYTVKISTDQKDYYKVSQITVNFKTGRVSVEREYNDYTALDDTKSSSSTGGSSSDNSGSSTSGNQSSTAGGNTTNR